MLQESLESLNALSEGSKERMPDFENFRSRMTDELKAKTLVAIARAQLTLDDKPAARTTRIVRSTEPTSEAVDNSEAM